MISVGIDVSKGKSMVCILKPYGEVVCSPFEVMHTDAVFPDLMDRKKCDIMKWTQTNPKSQEEFLCQSNLGRRQFLLLPSEDISTVILISIKSIPSSRII